LGFNDLTLYQPWREAVLAGQLPGGGYEDDLTGDLTLNAGVGGSGHTVVTYHWEVNSGTPIVRETTTPMLTLTEAELNALGEGVHNVTLTVTTADGATGVNVATAPLLLTPEPATMALLGLGGLVALIRRRVR
jgi:hypothetical protein